MTHCFSLFPSNLSNSNGSLQRTNKAALFHYLLAKFLDMKIIKIPQNTAQILDGMAIIQLLVDHVPAMFDDLSIYIFRSIIKSLFPFICPQELTLYVIKYNPLSIKDSERRQHLISTGYLLCALNENQKTPIKFWKFLISGKNKKSLVPFMVMH